MSNVHISNNIIPKKYFLTVCPIGPHYYYFKARCIIFFINNSCNNTIILHLDELYIQQIFLTDLTEEEMSQSDADNLINPYIDQKQWYNLKKIQYDNLNQQLFLTFDIVPNWGLIVIDYIGNIYDNPPGFFKMKQNNKLILCTVFEPIYARKCFPCLDEPSFKALFNIRILAPKNSFAISNTNSTKIIKTAKYNKYIFTETPPLSTYLVAFYISEIIFEQPSEKTINNTIVTIYDDSPLEFQNFVLANAIKCANIFVDIFKLNYVLPKLDIVFVPTFEVDAMENLGLITIKKMDSSNILTTKSKMEIIQTIFHEMTHQWFGNLVSITKWSEIWLNEGIATWFSFYFMKMFYPKQEMVEYFYVPYTRDTIEKNALTTSQPVIHQTKNICEIRSVFNLMTSFKGAMIIDMIATYIGLKKLFQGFHLYLKKYSYKNVTTHDLIECLAFFCEDHTVKLNLMNIFDIWTTEKFCPLINIEYTSHLASNTVLVTQEVFSFATVPKHWPVLKEQSTVPKHWPIPTGFERIINSKKEIHKFDIIDDIRKNFCVINYDFPLFKNLIDDPSNKLSSYDIAKIMNDNYLCLKAKKMNCQKYLACLSHIICNMHLKRLTLISGNIGTMASAIKSNYFYLKRISSKNQFITEYDNLMEKYINDLHKKYGTDFIFNDSHDIKKNDRLVDHLSLRGRCHDLIRTRTELFSIAQMLNNKKYTNKLDQVFQNIIHNKGDFDRKYIESIAIKYAVGNDYNFEELWEMSFDDKTILFAIIYTPNRDNYLRILETFIKSDINISDKLELLRRAGLNAQQNKYLWPFIKYNWQYLYEIFRHQQFSLDRMIDSMKMIVDTDNYIIEEISTFFSGKRDMQIIVAEILEQITINTSVNQYLDTY